jgi:pimeloyl-ACP methyl ester carboxylesterase
MLPCPNATFSRGSFSELVMIEKRIPALFIAFQQKKTDLLDPQVIL